MSQLVAPTGGWLDSGGGSSVDRASTPSGHHAQRRPIRVGGRNPQSGRNPRRSSQPGDRIVTSSTSRPSRATPSTSADPSGEPHLDPPPVHPAPLTSSDEVETTALADINLHRRPGRVPRRYGPFGLRQVDAAQHARHGRSPQCGPSIFSKRPRSRGARREPRLRNFSAENAGLRVPKLQPDRRAHHPREHRARSRLSQATPAAIAAQRVEAAMDRVGISHRAQAFSRISCRAASSSAPQSHARSSAHPS